MIFDVSCFGVFTRKQMAATIHTGLDKGFVTG